MTASRRAGLTATSGHRLLTRFSAAYNKRLSFKGFSTLYQFISITNLFIEKKLLPEPPRNVDAVPKKPELLKLKSRPFDMTVSLGASAKNTAL